MGKNNIKKGGKNKSSASNLKTQNKSSVGTDESNSNQNATEISNTQESGQVLDTQNNTQECQDIFYKARKENAPFSENRFALGKTSV